MKAVALLGEFDPKFPPHLATVSAFQHACDAANLPLSAQWVSTAEISPRLIPSFSGIWVVPGSPYKSLERTIEAIGRARVSGMPCFGTCGGFQHMIIEYARNVLQFVDAEHAEYDPYGSRLFISRLACSLAGRSMALEFARGSRVAEIYGSCSAIEEYYCNFGVNPEMTPLLNSGPLKITGSDAEGDVRVVELPDHPFFVGTLFVPQVRSKPTQPHPLIHAFVRAVARFNQGP